MTSLFGHAPEADPLRWKGPFPTKDRAVADARTIYPRTQGFYVIEGVPLTLGDFVPDANVLADVVLEEMWMHAFYKMGDRADAFPEAIDISPEYREELHRLVKSWVLRRLPNGWAPTKPPEYVKPLIQLTAVR